MPWVGPEPAVVLSIQMMILQHHATVLSGACIFWDQGYCISYLGKRDLVNRYSTLFRDKSAYSYDLMVVFFAWPTSIFQQGTISPLSCQLHPYYPSIFRSCLNVLYWRWVTHENTKPEWTCQSLSHEMKPQSVWGMGMGSYTVVLRYYALDLMMPC